MPYLDINDVHLYYEEQGDGAPIVLLHGGTGTIDSDSGWRRLRPALAEHYRAIFVEHRGHGRTNNPAERISYEMIADDVCALIDRLDLGPTHIAGMSDGGIAALHIAMTRPEVVRSLVCVGANYTVDDRIRETLRGVTPDRIEREQPAWHADLLRQHDAYKWPGYWRILVRQVVENAAVNPAYTLQDLQRIAVPTLLIAGDNDPFGNLDQMAAMKRNIPRSELLIVNNAGHIVQDTHPDIVGPVMLEFLSRAQSRGV